VAGPAAAGQRHKDIPPACVRRVRAAVHVARQHDRSSGLLADAEEVPVREVVSVEEPTDEIAQLERLLHVTTGERNRRADPWRVNPVSARPCWEAG
jgi:hypothetical protein